MFNFPLDCRGVAACYTIALPQGTLPDAEGRFGPALAFDEGPATYHEVGHLVVTHYFDGDRNMDLLLAVKDKLEPAELAQLIRELGNLVVDDVPLRVLALTPGWFARISSASEVRIVLAGTCP